MPPGCTLHGVPYGQFCFTCSSMPQSAVAMPQPAVACPVPVAIDEDALRDAVLRVIAGHATVMPGETLVIRCQGWNPEQAQYYQEDLDRRGLPFRVLVVIGDELAVAGLLA
jgi:hypothetical protein